MRSRVSYVLCAQEGSILRFNLKNIRGSRLQEKSHTQGKPQEKKSERVKTKEASLSVSVPVTVRLRLSWCPHFLGLDAGEGEKQGKEPERSKGERDA